MRAQGRVSQGEHLAGAKDRDWNWYKTGLASMAKGQICLTTSFCNKVLLEHSHSHLLTLFLCYNGKNGLIVIETIRPKG